MSHNPTLNEAKSALDYVINISRVHFYKPIQIAEILYHHRTQPDTLEPENLSTYRLDSKRWRDAVSERLVGRVSTSSARYQDDLFNDNAVPPQTLAVLAAANRETNGVVENYIYQRIGQKWGDLLDAYSYVTDTTVEEFSLETFLDFFERRAGLARSVDKAYEIVVYALFSTLVKALDARMTLSLDNPDPDLLEDFDKFIEYVLGLSEDMTEDTIPARLYRAGVTNAADRGLDIWTNYGPAIQVKHLRLDANLAQGISEEVPANNIVIVCKTAEADLIQSLLNQVGLRIRGIITQDDLVSWYQLSQFKYRDRLGGDLLNDLQLEFRQEFPQVGELDDFLDERGYQVAELAAPWGMPTE